MIGSSPSLAGLHKAALTLVRQPYSLPAHQYPILVLEGVHSSSALQNPLLLPQAKVCGPARDRSAPNSCDRLCENSCTLACKDSAGVTNICAMASSPSMRTLTKVEPLQDSLISESIRFFCILSNTLGMLYCRENVLSSSSYNLFLSARLVMMSRLSWLTLLGLKSGLHAGAGAIGISLFQLVLLLSWLDS